jgi:hypothetical protein
MNDGFLSAECVIDYLCNLGFVQKSNWKHNTRELYYTASFHVNETRCSIVTFEVSVIHNTHLIPKSRIRTLAKLFKKDFDSVFTACAI